MIPPTRLGLAALGATRRAPPGQGRSRAPCAAGAVAAVLSGTFAFAQEETGTAPARPVQAAVPGCWVNFFDNENFQGAQYRYSGPSDVRNIWNFVSVSGSISTGPRAHVVLYADANFQDQALSIGPGERIADVGARTEDVGVTFGSMQIRCG